jgi:hypothetical protein
MISVVLIDLDLKMTNSGATGDQFITILIL